MTTSGPTSRPDHAPSTSASPTRAGSRRSHVRRVVAGVTVAGLVAVGGAGAAWAAGDGSTSAARGPAATARATHPALRLGALKVAADALGMSPKDLARELRSGKSIADVAKSRDVDLSKVTDALEQAGKDAIAKAVDAGRLDEQRAQKIEASLHGRIEKLVHRTGHARKGRAAAHQLRRARAGAVKVAADTIGVPPRELLGQIRSGKTVADVAKANGVDPQKVVDAIVAAGTKRIDAAVQSGKLDETRAVKVKDRLADVASRFVNETPRRGHSGNGQGNTTQS